MTDCKLRILSDTVKYYGNMMEKPYIIDILICREEFWMPNDLNREPIFYHNNFCYNNTYCTGCTVKNSVRKQNIKNKLCIIIGQSLREVRDSLEKRTICQVQKQLSFDNYPKIIIAVEINYSFRQDKFYKYCNEFAKKISSLSTENNIAQKTPDLATRGYELCIISKSKQSIKSKKSKNQCCICMKNNSCVLGCGHVFACVDCINKMKNNENESMKCPLCRQYSNCIIELKTIIDKTDYVCCEDFSTNNYEKSNEYYPACGHHNVCCVKCCDSNSNVEKCRVCDCRVMSKIKLFL
jgi:hypothetical protein